MAKGFGDGFAYTENEIAKPIQKEGERMAKKMPKREEKNYWNCHLTWMGIILIILAVFLAFLILGVSILNSNPPPKIGSFKFFIQYIFSMFLGITGILLLVLPEVNEKCYYCKKKITRFKPYLWVEWPEPTKYSEKETTVNEAMHKKCHEAAKERGAAFKIPDPRFSAIEI